MAKTIGLTLPNEKPINPSKPPKDEKPAGEPTVKKK